MTLQSTTDKRVIVKISLELLEEKKVKVEKKRKWREKSRDVNQMAHEVLLQETGAFEKKDQSDLYKEIMLNEILAKQICREFQDIQSENESTNILPRYESPQTEMKKKNGKSNDEVKDLMNHIRDVWTKKLCDREKMAMENLAVRINCFLSEIFINIARELADYLIEPLKTSLEKNAKTDARENIDDTCCDLGTIEKTAARGLADNVMNNLKTILEKENLGGEGDKIEIFLLSSIKESPSRELSDNVIETILEKNISITVKRDLLNIIAARKLADNVMNNFKTILEEEILAFRIKRWDKREEEEGERESVKILLPSIEKSALRELADNVMIHLKSWIHLKFKKILDSTDASESNSSKASESALVSSSCELQTTLDD